MKRLSGKQVSDLAFGEFLQKLKHQSRKRLRLGNQGLETPPDKVALFD